MVGEYTTYQFLTVFLIVAIAFPLLPLTIAYFIAPRKPGADKNATYECGIEAKGDAWVQFRSEYYLYAIIFLIFDVETVFLIPFAVAFTELPVGAFLAIALFVLLLVEGLVWAWMKGVLQWK
ncbi:MAG: NADH:ubiquinone oxidoreductase subunit 3 (subunit A) [Limisphaerales bacterium]|jgi:NADH:ubiquinone oxidoreductase subunit 3 (subunit A)